ncbi:HSP70-domain-containing protein [Thelephora ganbajun]|uniref:HSP70-domain-containing protein n=1 Tax=Thelephora ganbajun TaxID=370292 RepID=A0ACB6ZIM0_THEGA|nr:HSP70-domain-containing protein [Thelephora ganbajun]
MSRNLLLGFLCLLTLNLPQVLASLLAIDYGSEWIKASLMKPGVPFDVLLNKDSKRKIQSSIGWKNDDRLFGSDAYNLATKFPTDSFNFLKYLQGVPFDSEAVSYYATLSAADTVKSSRNTISLRRSDGTEWAVEELIAMQFSYVKELAESVAGEKVTDVIVTVPPFYTQAERDAVVDAIEIAGLRTLALVNDGTAVAINYAMTRTFPEPEIHIIYDAGASAIRTTLVEFSTVESTGKGKPKTYTQVKVLSSGFDRRSGGTELDRRLLKFLVEDFMNKNQVDITKDKRAMSKFRKEANRLKVILSANNEAVSTIESAYKDIDYRGKIKRSQFEATASDLQVRFVIPLHTCLAKVGLTFENVTSVILTGGASRTPMIQQAVKTTVGESKVAANVNADEAAVLGAGLYGASLSRQFKTKDIKVSDVYMYDIQASYTTEPKEGGSSKIITSTIFPPSSKAGSTKTLTFKRKDDFSIRLLYKKTPFIDHSQGIAEAKIGGVAEAIANLTEKGVPEPVIKTTVALSESGFVSISDAIAVGQVKQDFIKGLFSGADSEPAVLTDESTTSEDMPKSLGLELTIPLTIDFEFGSTPPMTAEEKRAAHNRLREIDNIEGSKRRKEEARNNLESYLYKLRDLLGDESQTPFRKCSQPGERSAIQKKLEGTLTWIHDEADDADTTQFLEKLSGLESLERPIAHRYKEIEEFPKALNNSQMWNWSSRLFITEAKQNLTAEAEGGAPARYTKAEIDALEKALKEHEAWLAEWVAKQRQVPMSQDPVILTSEMRARAKTLENHLQKLWKKKVPLKKSNGSQGSSSGTPSGTGTSGTPPEDTVKIHDEL